MDLVFAAGSSPFLPPPRWSLRARSSPKLCCFQNGRAVETRDEEEDEEERRRDGPVIKFAASDLAVSDRVSVGHHGRSDELIFEATVTDPRSPLHNSRVVLRQLTSFQAKRRGRRALEVLKKLARRHLMYHSYAMQVHGYVSQSDLDASGDAPFTLIHGYHGSYSLRHWLQLSDWLPTLEATLALDEEGVRRVGDDTVGGPAVTRQLRLTRILMRDILIGVNYLHSHGLAHTELRLENLHVSPIDKHVKVGILGNAVDFYDDGQGESEAESNNDRRKLMIAFDMRCVGFIMAKLVLKELMDASIFLRFKSFLTKGNDPSCLREFLLPILCRNSPSGNVGLQMLDRNWGAGWNLLSRLLALEPSDRISCLAALRHPFLCGPLWRVTPSLDIVRWGLGSTAVRLAEDYIYGHHQRRRIAYFIELMELQNPHPKLGDWSDLLLGRWRLLYCTGRHIGLTLRQPSSRVLINDVHLFFAQAPHKSDTAMFAMSSEVHFRVMPASEWPHDKSGPEWHLQVKCSTRMAPSRVFFSEADDGMTVPRSSAKKKKPSYMKELPSSIPAVKLMADEIDVSMNTTSSPTIDAAKRIIHEVRMQIPPEMFDLSKLVCGTYIDTRLMILRGVNGSSLLFIRSSPTTTQLSEASRF